MYEAVMIASAGLKNQQRRLDTIADNVSNVNTTAYKSSRLDFKDALYTAGIVPGAPRSPEANQQKGHGVMVGAITKDFTTGSIYITDNPLDLAIDGKGFFELEDANGNIVYTRTGNLRLGEDGTGTFFLLDSDGYYVLDENGERIQAPENTNTVSVGEDGIITFKNGDEETTYKLGVYTFENERGLVSAGSSNYAESEASGERLPSEAKIKQGAIEGSNVNLAEEMTRLIRTQRAFSLASRALSTADEMEGIANSMKK